MPSTAAAEAAAGESASRPAGAVHAAALALGCALLADAALRWSPLTGRPLVDAAAGITLAAVVAWGRWAALPAALGVMGGTLAWSRGGCLVACTGWGDALWAGLAAGLHGLIGAWWWQRRTVAPVRLLTEPRDVLVFVAFAAALPATAVALLGLGWDTIASALAGTPGLPALARQAEHAVAATLGTAVVAPLFWAWCSQPRADWAPRRGPLTAVIVLAFVLTHLGTAVVVEADAKRGRSDFERAAQHSAVQLESQLQGAQHALRAMQSLFVGGRAIGPEEFRAAAAPWLAAPSLLQALGWSECLGGSEVAAFEARARAEGQPALRVLSAVGDGSARPPRPGDEPLVVIRFVEPLETNRLAPGTNSRANPATGAAIDAALRSGTPTATESFPLRLPAAELAAGPRLAVVLYLAVDGAGRPSACAPQRGVVFATLRIAQLWQPVVDAASMPLALCLVDRGRDGSAHVLGGALGCETGRRGAVHTLNVGDRRWELVATAPERRPAETLIAVQTHAATAGLALTVGLLLVVTGRARRVERAIADAQTARAAAESANLAKSDFLSRMSHELRTPLNAVIGFAQLLETARAPALQPGQQRWAANIRQAGHHLLEMIGEILDLSRIEAGTLQLSIESLEVGTLVREVVTLIERGAEARRVTIVVELDPQAAWLRGDATRVRQILTNLLSNAVKYNRDGGRITLRTRHAYAAVEVEVRDSGLGMDAQQLAQLFQPFNRLGRERSGVEGTGIGLVICQRLAQMMGGGLRVASVPGEGSTFTLALPQGEPVEPPPVAAPRQVPAPASVRAATPLRIHCIEDNPINAEIVRAFVGQLDHVELRISENGSAALADLLAADAAPADLVLLDLHLPDIDGIDLLRRLKAEPATRAVPVVVLSADATTRSHQAAVAEGAADYLTKPLQMDRLLELLRRYQQRSA